MFFILSIKIKKNKKKKKKKKKKKNRHIWDRKRGHLFHCTLRGMHFHFFIINVYNIQNSKRIK